jgi:hypothetical protein
MNEKDIIDEIVDYIKKERGSIYIEFENYKIFIKTSTDPEVIHRRGLYIADIYPVNLYRPISFNLYSLPYSILKDTLWEIYGENYL